MCALFVHRLRSDAIRPSEARVASDAMGSRASLRSNKRSGGAYRQYPRQSTSLAPSEGGGSRGRRARVASTSALLSPRNGGNRRGGVDY
jgi:hypothetical protein